MSNLLRPLLLATACTLAFPSMAADRCEHSRAETPHLDLAGITRVVVGIGADELTIEPGAPSLTARHCASTADRLADSELRIERRGGTLHIVASSAGRSNFNWFADQDYLHREISLTLPVDLPLSLDVGSGDAAVRGLSDITIDLGSGDIALRQVGRVVAEVGSGDLSVERATAVTVDVGSGDAVLRGIQGEARAHVGSGDVEMNDVGRLQGLRAGSGSIAVEGVRGDAHIDSVGSGDIRLVRVRGTVRVGDVGSGEVDLVDVDGDVIVADKDTLDDIDTRGVRGRFIVGG